MDEAQGDDAARKAAARPAIEILIGEDGEVIFPDLDADMLDVALALDPDSSLACRRPVGAPVDDASEGAADGAGDGVRGGGDQAAD